MATSTHRLIKLIDRESHRLGVALKERGVNKRILLHRDTGLMISPDGDKLLVEAINRRTGRLLWKNRLSVEYIILIMHTLAELRSSEPNIA